MSVFVVSTANFSGAGSLSEALTLAASNAGHDEIVFSSAVSGQSIYLLGTLVLAQDVSIDGDIDDDGSADIVLDGNGNRIMTVSSGAIVHIDGVTFYDGQQDFGSSNNSDRAVSAIHNSGTLSVTHSIFQQNSAVGGYGSQPIGAPGLTGGDAATIFNASGATLTLDRVTFVSNSAIAGRGGYGGSGGAGIPNGYTGYDGGRGGNAATAVLNEGTATLSMVLPQFNTAFGGAGGDGGYGGYGLMSGGDGGTGGNGGSAATFMSTSGTLTVSSFAYSETNIGGSGGSPGNGGTGGGFSGISGSPGADGVSALVLGSATVSTIHVVDSATDDGSGGLTLREAIAGAAAGDTIIFDAGLSGAMIQLTTTELAIVQDLTIDGDIDGDGDADITISGDKNNSGTNDAGDVRIFNISGTYTDVALRSLTLTGGRADALNNDDGGAILTAITTTLRIDGVSITNSFASSGGGGVYAHGDFQAVNSLFQGNSATLGGALYIKGSTASLLNTTMTGNSASNLGGAIDTDTGSSVRLFGSTITANHATNGGGGIDVFGSRLYAYNTILSGNTAGTGAANADVRRDLGVPNYIKADYSLLGTGAGLTLDVDGGHNILSNTPLLGVLADNGGPVKTMAPLSGSAAIDAGSTDIDYVTQDLLDIDRDGDIAEATPIDARGIARVLGNSFDIGAVELPAVNDGTFIAEGFGTVSGNVLTNDGGGNKSVTGIQVGTEGSAGAFDSFSSPQPIVGDYGTLIIESDGSYTYFLDNTDASVQALASGQSVFDFFTYQLNQNGLVDIATLNVAVNGINDKPVGVNDANTGDPVVEATTTSAGDAQATGNVLTNDTDTDTGDTKAVNGVRAGSNEASLGPFSAAGATVTGTYGTLTISANGTYTYTLNNADSDTQALGAGVTAHDYFTYRVRDSFVITDLAVLDIRVTGANDAPTAVADTRLAAEDVTTTFQFLDLVGNDKDPEGALGAIVSVTSGVHGTAVLNSNGTVSFTPTANFNGAATFTYKFADGAGLQSNTATVTVNVGAENDAPVLNGSTSFNAAENGTAVGTVPFADIDVGDTLTYFVNGGADADMFQVNVNTGVLTFVAPHDYETPNDADANGSYEVIIRAYDGEAFIDQQFGVTVTNVVGNTINGKKTADTIDGTKPVGNTATGEEDTINGKAGNDTIKALGGNDTVKGGKGVDDLDGGDGTRDAVDFSDMKLAVELTLKGSKSAIAKVGGVADDTLKNFESILGGKAGDKLTGDAKANLLSGNAGNDSLNGGKGIDTLKGGLGADTLTGGKGAMLDVFLFDSALGSANIDIVTDFKHGIDKIALDDAIFAAIGPTLEPGELFSKSGALKAKQLDDRLVYDTKTGNLSYDADGKGGAAAIHFATLTDGSKPAILDVNDILIV